MLTESYRSKSATKIDSVGQNYEPISSTRDDGCIESMVHIEERKRPRLIQQRQAYKKIVAEKMGEGKMEQKPMRCHAWCAL